MTTNAIKPLPPIAPTDEHSLFVAKCEYDALRSYTEDCLARLGVAVALLDKLYEQDCSDDCTFMDEDNHALIELHEALAAIGPLARPSH